MPPALASPSAAKEERAFIWFLIGVSAALHLFMATLMGAKYWWDTISYFQLAEVLFNPDGLRALYAGPFGIIYQHVMPGLPALIVLFEKLFGSALWPAFAIFQNTLDIAASVYLATGFSRRIGRCGQLAIVALIALSPYFSAFNNALLTESLTASLVMIAVGATIRCLEGRIGLAAGVTIVLMAGIVGGEIRSYTLLTGAGLSVLMIFCIARFSRLWLYAVVAIATVAAASVFPVYRAALGIEFFYPRVDALMLKHANYVNWNLDERSKLAVERAVSDPQIRTKLETADQNVTEDDILKMVDDLMRSGRTRAEAIKEIGRAALVVRTQSWEVIARQLQLSWASLGFQIVPVCCLPNRIMRNGGFTAKRMAGHFFSYYKWNAGLSSDDYRATFDGFTEGYRAQSKYYSQSAIDWYAGRVRPYVREHPSRWRNFLGLNYIPPDILILLALGGFCILAAHDWRMSVILIFLAVPVYAAALYAAFVGDNRHAHLLWPFYITGIVALFEWVVARYRPSLALKQGCRGFSGYRLLVRGLKPKSAG